VGEQQALQALVLLHVRVKELLPLLLPHLRPALLPRQPTSEGFKSCKGCAPWAKQS
jgi:hypothetical protein